MSHIQGCTDLTQVFGQKSSLISPRTIHPFSRRPLRSKKRSWNWHKMQTILKHLFEEFCSSTTIHGMHYIGASKTLLGRIGWMIAFVFSVLCCGMLIQNVYQKWDNNPVIVSFDDAPTPVWKIPFPAITVCPEDKISADVMNFTEDFYTHFHTNKTLSENRLDRLMAVLQICDGFFHMNSFYGGKYPNETKEVVSFIDEVLIRSSVMCGYEDESCNEGRISETLTEDGICFTYNGFSAKDMFNDGVLHDQYEYLSETRTAVNWSMENGYAPGTPFETYPLRGTGYALPLQFELERDTRDMEEYCTGRHRFKIILHSPDEYPLPFAKHLMISLDQDVEIAIRPEILVTSENLLSYSPNRRQCFFNNERQLKFFRVYNQNNCELECITNYTLKVCGCVRFSMPRTEETRVCSTAEQQCIKEAYRVLQMYSKDQVMACNCMSACSSIKFHTEISQSANDKASYELRLGIFYGKPFDSGALYLF